MPKLKQPVVLEERKTDKFFKRLYRRRDLSKAEERRNWEEWKTKKNREMIDICKTDSMHDLASLKKMRNEFLRCRAKLENPHLTEAEAKDILADIDELLVTIPKNKPGRVIDALMIGHQAELIHDILHGTNLWNESMKPA